MMSMIWAVVLALIFLTAMAYPSRKSLPTRYSHRLLYTDHEIPPRPTNNDEVYDFTRTKRIDNPLVKRRGMPKYERDIKRRKLFILSTVLEDLLPDPTQGQSKLLNSLVDAGKITRRAAFKIFNYIFELPTSLSIALILLLFAYSGTLYLPFVPPFLRIF